ncbi:GNAT family N-acetyltransferase [Shewanella waksmanii]|uniref:GNAT family N-acetyltransferase n=1 Tax=Shewanella waksmanii TaxID=213783 RepID=UPI0037365969
MIRLANQQDLAQVQKLYQVLRPHDPELSAEVAAQTWRRLCEDSNTHIIVAEVEGQLASTYSLTLNLSLANGARPFAMIEHVITLDAFRRRGLSQAVLKYGIELAWQLDCYNTNRHKDVIAQREFSASETRQRMKGIVTLRSSSFTQYQKC